MLLRPTLMNCRWGKSWAVNAKAFRDAPTRVSEGAKVKEVDGKSYGGKYEDYVNW